MTERRAAPVVGATNALPPGAARGVAAGDSGGGLRRRYSARTRKRIWDQAAGGVEAGDAVLAWIAPTDQSFDFRTAGRNRREPVDFDGLRLLAFRQREQD